MRLTAFAPVAALIAAITAQSLAPSPTESVGCVPHDDHWHCDGPRATPIGAAITTTTTSAGSLLTITTTTRSGSSSAYNDAAGTGSLAPSPSNSIGCEPHGDHWHCSGPRVTGASAVSGSASGSVSRSASAPLTVSTGGVAALVRPGAGGSGALGAAALVAAAGLALVA